MASHNSTRRYRGHHAAGHGCQTSGRCLSRTSLGYRTTTGIVSGFSRLMPVSSLQSDLSHSCLHFKTTTRNCGKCDAFQLEAARRHSSPILLQDAQLSQRDRAAGCVIVFAKSRRLELGDDILWTL